MESSDRMAPHATARSISILQCLEADHYRTDVDGNESVSTRSPPGMSFFPFGSPHSSKSTIAWSPFSADSPHSYKRYGMLDYSSSPSLAHEVNTQNLHSPLQRNRRDFEPARLNLTTRMPTPPARQAPASEPPTTLVLRHIPNKCTRDMILEEFASRDLMKDIDFFYMPIDPRHQRNAGYCFVNMTSQDAVDRFSAAFEGATLEAIHNDKTCQVGMGKVQGLAANIAAYRNSALMSMDKKFQPLLFFNGEPHPFPGPTSPVRSKFDKRKQ